MCKNIVFRFFAIFWTTTFTVLPPTYADSADSSDALIVLTTVGYITGAADTCKVSPEKSNQLASGIALAISTGNYGDPSQAHVLLNNARQKGIADAAAGKVNCVKVGDLVNQYVRSLLSQ
jgi:hypothetical protein